MNIFLIFDDCPQEFGEREIIQPAYLSSRMAKFEMNKLKAKNSYQYQYLKVIKVKVKVNPEMFRSK